MLLKWVGWGFWGRHAPKITVEDKETQQKKSMFTYMVHSAFKKGDELQPRQDQYVGYFMDGWNWLDFIVVVFGSIVPMASNLSSVSSIRSLRILRALRAIPRVPSYVDTSYKSIANLPAIYTQNTCPKHVPQTTQNRKFDHFKLVLVLSFCKYTELRVLVMTIIDAIPALSGAIMILGFFFAVFGIIGITSFNGVLREQCAHSVSGEVLTFTAVDTEYTAFCRYDESEDGNGKVYAGKDEYFRGQYISCNDVADKLWMNGTQDHTMWECTKDQDNPSAGMQNYDFIWYALLQIFQTVTLQDWSDQTYNLSRSMGYNPAFFFVVVTFLVSFYSINLILSGL